MQSIQKVTVENANRRHFELFDMIRALAAMAVCISHLRNLMVVDYRPDVNLAGKAFYFVTNYGHQAVLVFFLLSGYFVGGSVIRDVAASRWSWSKYLMDRLTRLWVVLIPVLLLTLFWDRLGLSLAGGPFYLGTEGNLDQTVDVVRQLGPATFACNVAFLQNVVCNTYGSNGPLWSLANEFWYYLWFPAIYVALRVHRGNSRWLIAAIAVASMWIFSSYLTGFFLWLMGAALARLQTGFPLRRERTGMPWMSLVCTVLMAGALVVSRFHDATWMIGAAFFLLLLSILWERVGFVHNGLMARASTLFSGFSYSLYLTHFPLIVFVMAVGVGHRLQWSTGTFGLFCALFGVCYLYAYAVYWIFERNTKSVRQLLGGSQPIGLNKITK